MSRILVRSAQRPDVVLPPGQSSRAMGGNAGNLLYANSTLRALSVDGAEVVAGAFRMHKHHDLAAWARRTSRRYDRFVIPMSNAFRSGFTDDLEKMAIAIEMLDIPVNVVGVGAQTTVDAVEGDGPIVMGRTGSGKLPSAQAAARHDAVVHRFVDAVLARSESIGVRGEVTKRYLTGIGVDESRVDVIGCPSLFTWGPDLRIPNPPDPLRDDARISLNLDHRVAGVADLVELNAERYRNLTVAVQDTRSARAVIAGAREFDMSRFDARLPIHPDHELYRSRRMLFYPNAWGWIESLGTEDFVLGTRLHGNIAGILGGTPAHLLVHDSRTSELADYHGIPSTRLQDLDHVPTAGELAARTDYTRFNELQPERFATYLDFLHRNGIETVFDEGRDATAFDRSIAAGRATGPVRPAVGPLRTLVRQGRRLSDLVARRGDLQGN